MSRCHTISDWARLLRAASEPIAAPALPESEQAIGDFRDEFGHRRTVDEPLIRHLCTFTPIAADGRGPTPHTPPRTPDVALWWMTHEANSNMSPDPWAWIEPGKGSLTHPSDTTAIEIWTETELSTLHAAWTIATSLGDERLTERCLAAALWHTRELQPDNGTNHPWAIHVFLELWSRLGTVEARLHAETMLHNCTVQQGHPDVFSALILLHASRSLGTESISSLD
jgi:hypothetical protein